MSSSRLTGAQLAAVGAVAIDSASLDLYLEECIWLLCGMDEPLGSHFTSGGTLGTRIQALHKIIKLKTADPKALEDFQWLQSKADDLVPKRNLLIHGRWHTDPEVRNQLLAMIRPGYVIAKKRSGPGQIKAKEALKLSEQFRALHEIYAVAMLDHFPDAPHAGPYPSPRKSVQQLRKDYKNQYQV